MITNEQLDERANVLATMDTPNGKHWDVRLLAAFKVHRAALEVDRESLRLMQDEIFFIEDEGVFLEWDTHITTLRKRLGLTK